MVGRENIGTIIGMSDIKQRRLEELFLRSRPGLRVGSCVPFYFGPRSIMLFLIHCANHPQLDYRGGQQPICHLQSDLHAAVEWAEQENLKWAFTLSNAGAYYFEDRCELAQLDEIDWTAVEARKWSGTGISSGINRYSQGIFNRASLSVIAVSEPTTTVRKAPKVAFDTRMEFPWG